MMSARAYCERCAAGCMASWRLLAVLMRARCVPVEPPRQQLRRYGPAARSSVSTLCVAAENEALDCLGEAFFSVRVGRYIGLRLHLLGGIAHGNAETGTLEHQNVIGRIANGCDLRWRNSEMGRQIVNNGALVCILVGDVEVIWLGPIGRRLSAEGGLDICFALTDPLEIVADASDLRNCIKPVVEIRHDGRLELDRPGLARD